MLHPYPVKVTWHLFLDMLAFLHDGIRWFFLDDFVCYSLGAWYSTSDTHGNITVSWQHDGRTTFPLRRPLNLDLKSVWTLRQNQLNPKMMHLHRDRPEEDREASSEHK